MQYRVTVGIVERQYIQKGIAGPYGQYLQNRADVGAEILMVDHHAFGVAGGAGCINDTSQIRARNGCMVSQRLTGFYLRPGAADSLLLLFGQWLF